MDHDLGSADDLRALVASPPPRPDRPPRRRLRIIAAGTYAALLAMLAFAASTWIHDGGEAPGAQPVSRDVQAIADRVTPAVVEITSFGDPQPFGTLGPGRGRVPLGRGSGMILTPEGEILTNNHVVQGSTRLEVRVRGDATTYAARVLGVSPKSDVALIQLAEASGLPTVHLGDSTLLDVGGQVVAIGNADGVLEPPTVTAGEIARVDENIRVRDGHGNSAPLLHMMEVTSPVRPGESGGALVNGDAEIIGMITAGTRHQEDGASPVGFAVPIATAKLVVDEIEHHSDDPDIIVGKTAVIGVEVRRLRSDDGQVADLGVRRGTLVLGVTPGSPAESAGITGGAVIVAVDGSPIRGTNDLARTLHAHRPGERATVSWVDDGGRHTASIRMVAGPTA